MIGGPSDLEDLRKCFGHSEENKRIEIVVRSAMPTLSSCLLSFFHSLGYVYSSTDLSSAFGLATSLQSVDDAEDAFLVDDFIEIFIDLDDRASGAGTKTLDFDQSEQAVRGGFAHSNAELSLENINDGFSASQLARSCAANCDEIFSNRLTIEHGIERSSLKRKKRMLNLRKGKRKKTS